MCLCSWESRRRLLLLVVVMVVMVVVVQWWRQWHSTLSSHGCTTSVCPRNPPIKSIMPPHVPPVRRSGCSDGFKVKVRFSVHCHDRLRTNQTWRASLFWTWSMSRVVLHFTQCRRCRWTKNRKEGCPGFEFDLSPGIFVHDLESTVDVWAGEKTNDSKFGLPLAFFRCSCCEDNDLFLLFLFLNELL